MELPVTVVGMLWISRKRLLMSFYFLADLSSPATASLAYQHASAKRIGRSGAQALYERDPKLFPE